MKMSPDRFQQTAGSVAAETANAPIRGAKAQMGLPPDAPLPGKTLRRFIRSGAPWLAATRAVESALSQFGRPARTKPRKA